MKQTTNYKGQPERAKRDGLLDIYKLEEFFFRKLNFLEEELTKKMEKYKLKVELDYTFHCANQPLKFFVKVSKTNKKGELIGFSKTETNSNWESMVEEAISAVKWIVKDYEDQKGGN